MPLDKPVHPEGHSFLNPDTERRSFRKSSFSGAGSSDCVEVAGIDGCVMIRDSKLRDGETLPFPSASWREFIERLRD
jgi:hypothetical protein